MSQGKGNTRNQRVFKILSWSAAATLACSLCAAQDSPSIAEQLGAQYKYAKITKDSNGNQTIADGATVLAIQKTGVVGVPYANALKPCPSTYIDGTLNKPNAWCQAGKKAGTKAIKDATIGFLTRLLPGGAAADAATGAVANSTSEDTTPPVDLAVGQKVYPQSIAVDTKANTVKFGVVACNPCNGNDPPTYYKAEVDFRLPKGLLASGDASQVEDTIGQVFSIDSGGDATQGQDAQAAPAQTAGQGEAAAPASPAPAPEPVSIQQGQTIEEVEQALGKPTKIFTTATKVIWVYPDLKITFRHGKVTDVQ